jgi:hypothetical protein
MIGSGSVFSSCVPRMECHCGGTTTMWHGPTCLASLLAARHANAEARSLLKTIQDGGPIDHHIAYSLGAAHAQLGDFSDARRFLADAARTGLPCYPWYARDRCWIHCETTRNSSDSSVDWRVHGGWSPRGTLRQQAHPAGIDARREPPSAGLNSLSLMTKGVDGHV